MKEASLVTGTNGWYNGWVWRKKSFSQARYRRRTVRAVTHLEIWCGSLKSREKKEKKHLSSTQGYPMRHGSFIVCSVGLAIRLMWLVKMIACTGRLCWGALKFVMQKEQNRRKKLPAAEPDHEVTKTQCSPFHRAFQCRILEAVYSQKELWSRHQRLRHRSRCSWWGFLGKGGAADASLSQRKPSNSDVVTSQNFFPSMSVTWIWWPMSTLLTS